jgi:hypothetical protein
MVSAVFHPGAVKAPAAIADRASQPSDYVHFGGHP